MARKCEIIDPIQSAMLPRNNMLDVVSQLAVSLMKPTLLTAVAGPFTNRRTPASIATEESDPNATVP